MADRNAVVMALTDAADIGAGMATSRTRAGTMGSKRGQAEEASAATKRSAFGDITNHGRPQTASRQQQKPGLEAIVRGTAIANSDSLEAFQQEALRRSSPPDGAAQQPIGSVPGDDTLAASRRRRSAHPILDIDADASLLTCPEYAKEIMQHLQEAELKRRPSTSYMEFVQEDINVSMRCILVDWLIEVVQEYAMVSDTLYLAVSYLDRYLSTHRVMRSRLQLVGVVCLLLAAKYEEIYAPNIEEFCYITDNTYSRGDVLAMEEHLLGELRFELTVATPKTFHRRFIQAAISSGQGGERLEHLSAYITELSLLDYGSLQFLPSMVAAAAVLVAQYVLGKVVWSPTMAHYTSYTPQQLAPAARLLFSCMRDAPHSKMPACHAKYSSERFEAVSRIKIQDSLPDWVFR